MAWDSLLQFGKEAWGVLKNLWKEGSDKISGKVFDKNAFYDGVRSTGKNAFVMHENAEDLMRDQLDLRSLRLYNDIYSAKSQGELEQFYSNMYDENFARRMYKNQVQAAIKGKGDLAKFRNFFENMNEGISVDDAFKKLTKEQRESLTKEFRTQYEGKLNEIYEAYVPDNMVLSKNAKLNAKGQAVGSPSWIQKFEGDIVDNGVFGVNDVPSGADSYGLVHVGDTPMNTYNSGGGIGGPTVPLLEGPKPNTVERAVEIHERAKDLNFNYGMQKKFIKENTDVLNFATSNTSDMRDFNKAINESKYAKELDAYRSYLNNNLMTVPTKEGTWKNPDSIYDYFTGLGYNIDDANALKTEYNKLISKRIASGNPDHSGIDIWGMAKRHPVIATGVVMGTAFGISELAEEDSL